MIYFPVVGLNNGDTVGHWKQQCWKSFRVCLHLIWISFLWTSWTEWQSSSQHRNFQEKHLIMSFGRPAMIDCNCSSIIIIRHQLILTYAMTWYDQNKWFTQLVDFLFWFLIKKTTTLIRTRSLKTETSDLWQLACDLYDKTFCPDENTDLSLAAADFFLTLTCCFLFSSVRSGGWRAAAEFLLTQRATVSSTAATLTSSCTRTGRDRSSTPGTTEWSEWSAFALTAALTSS